MEPILTRWGYINGDFGQGHGVTEGNQIRAFLRSLNPCYSRSGKQIPLKQPTIKYGL
jgi:hypothetical protein